MAGEVGQLTQLAPPGLFRSTRYRESLCQVGRYGFHPHSRIKYGVGFSPLPGEAGRGRYLQIVIPAKAGFQGLGHPSTSSGRTTCWFTYPCQP